MLPCAPKFIPRGLTSLFTEVTLTAVPARNVLPLIRAPWALSTPFI